MPSIFSKIIKGELPCVKILETDDFIAFLDAFPLVPGHVLVVPKIEVDYLFDLPKDSFGDLFLFSREIAAAIKSAIPCRKVGVSVIGLEVPHVHVHLVPINQVADMDFTRPKLRPTAAELEDVAKKIRKFL